MVKIRIKEINIKALSLILIFFAFFWYRAFWFASKIYVNYGVFVGIIDLIILLAVAGYIIENKGRIILPMVCILLFGMVIIAGSFITIYFTYSTICPPESMIASLGFTIMNTIPGMIMACIVVNDEKSKISLKNEIPVACTILTIYAVMVIAYVWDFGGGGNYSADYGIIYKYETELCALIAGLLIYEIFKTGFSKRYLRKNIYYLVLIIANILCMALSGGRTGFLCFGVMVLYILIWYFKTHPYQNTLILYIFLFFSIVLFGVAIIKFASRVTIGENAIYRMLSFFIKYDSSGRDVLFNKALTISSEHILFGHGFLAVYYLTGGTSHLSITDALINHGLVGTLLMMIITAAGIIKYREIIRNDKTMVLAGVILSYGIPRILFGEYLGEVTFFMPLAAIFAYRRPSINDTNEVIR